jgi:hypothetical protein
MTDRELLELAAKAAGLVHAKWSDACDEMITPSEHHSRFRRAGDWNIWNPLTDDGDAFRLMVKLGIHYSWNNDSHVELVSEVVTANDDRYAAARRAITRAAAEMGRKQQ